MSKHKLKIIMDKFILLGFDYDRMSQSGQETYDEISRLLGLDKATIQDVQDESYRANCLRKLLEERDMEV